MDLILGGHRSWRAPEYRGGSCYVWLDVYAALVRRSCDEWWEEFCHRVMLGANFTHVGGGDPFFLQRQG